MNDDVALAAADQVRLEFESKWLDCYPLLMNKARRLANGCSQDPEDLLSQATLKVLNYIQLEREIENFAGLMFLSLLQVHLDGKRRLGNRIFDYAKEIVEERGSFECERDLPCAERTFIAKQTLADIFECLGTMPCFYQELFELRFVQDLSYSEISKQMGISESSARQMVRKLRCKIKSWIE